MHISRKSSIFAAVLKVSDVVWCFQRLVFTYKTGVYTFCCWCSKFAVSNKFQPKQSNMDAMKNVFMQHIVCPWRTNLCAVFQTRNAIEPIVGYAAKAPNVFLPAPHLSGETGKERRPRAPKDSPSEHIRRGCSCSFSVGWVLRNLEHGTNNIVSALFVCLYPSPAIHIRNTIWIIFGNICW